MMGSPPPVPIVVMVPGAAIGGVYSVLIGPNGATVSGPDLSPSDFQQGATAALAAAAPGQSWPWQGEQQKTASTTGYFGTSTLPPPQTPTPSPSFAKPFAPPSWIAIVPIDVDADSYSLSHPGDWAHQWIATAKIGATALIEVTPDDLDAKGFTPAALQDESGPAAGTATQAMMQHIGAPALALVSWDKANGNLSVTFWTRQNSAASAPETSDPTTSQVATAAPVSSSVPVVPQALPVYQSSGFSISGAAAAGFTTYSSAVVAVAPPAAALVTPPSPPGPQTQTSNANDLQAAHGQALSMLGTLLTGAHNTQ